MTIPASSIVSVSPSVLTAGGSSFDLNGLLLTTSTRVPIGTVSDFPDAASVWNFFGAGSPEKAMADIYFNGFEGSTRKPGAMLFAQYNQTDVGAYVRGGNISALTLAQLQAISGSMTVTFEGFARTDAAIDLSASTSFSSAAGIIQTALNAAIPAGAAFTASIAATTLDVTAVSSGTVAIGQTVAGGTVEPNTIILEQLTGAPGGIGTYSVSVSQAEASGSLTAAATPIAVTFDSTSGAFVLTSGVAGTISTVAFPTGTLPPLIGLTSSTGAVLSPGAAAATPGPFMDGVFAATQNWAFFTTLFNPDVSGNANKLLFADWADGMDDRVGYVPWDEDLSPTVSGNATASLGRELAAADYDGTSLWFDLTGGSIAAFILGSLASINFDELNGRTNLSFRRQSGLKPSVETAEAAQNLTSNGYSFYGAYATANDEFVFTRNAFISGDFRWLDSFANQIWMTDRLQVALLTFLQSARSVPYNAAGRAMIEAALGDSIQAALNFGAIQPGIALSESQIASVNASAGVTISDTLFARGWYLQILPAPADVRAARGSPPMKFWYVDGQSVQSLNLETIAVQ